MPMPADSSNRHPNVVARDFGPDGSQWIIVIDGSVGSGDVCDSRKPCAPTADGLYVITQEAVTAAE